jgi:exodeoxyribonuclease VII large subunit
MSKDPPPPAQGNLFRLLERIKVSAAERAARPEEVTQPVPLPASPRAASAPRERVVLTVGQLTRQLKDLVELRFPTVWVQGEVSGFRGRNSSGHLYFNLKDEDACIDVKIWSSVAQRTKFQLRDGLSVICQGSIDLYEPRGRYSLVVQRIEPAGEGALALAFQQLKDRLAAEGLIGEARKRPPRPIPFLPRRIGVVTSVSGAALRDFLRVLHRRHPRLPVLVCDARVQGEGSVQDVIRALLRLSRTDVDVIVVTRGGGSVEDLWTFNEEQVARAIHACPIPVISAIGHEVDFTIADFIADFRAATPSAAAEKLAPVLLDLQLSLQTAESRLRKGVERQLLTDRQRLHRSSSKLADPRRIISQRQLYLSDQMDRVSSAVRAVLRLRLEGLGGQRERLDRQQPQARLGRNRRALNRWSERLRIAASALIVRHRRESAFLRTSVTRHAPKPAVHHHHRRLLGQLGRICEVQRRRLADEQRHFHNLAGQLEAMSPLQVLARGYSVTLKTIDGKVVRRASDVAMGESLTIKLAGAGCQQLKDCDQIEAKVTGIPGDQSLGRQTGDPDRSPVD